MCGCSDAAVTSATTATVGATATSPAALIAPGLAAAPTDGGTGVKYVGRGRSRERHRALWLFVAIFAAGYLLGRAK